MSCTFHSSLNYVSDILDEIALEGLDGITLEALWKRLSVRPKFLFSIDENSKKFIWNIIIHLKDLQFYEIPEARPSLKYYDYSVTEESVCNEIRVELNEVYPYSSVKNVPSIFGSCQYYAMRIDITKAVVQLTVEEAEAKWGNKLVVVASQDCRYSALLQNHCTPNIDFSSSHISYEMLERIGRCRQLGSLTCGKASLQALVVDVKSIFHYLKYLISHKLVRKQSLLGSLNSSSHASLVYLTRFFEESGNDNFSILQMALEELKVRPPHYMMPCTELYSLFDEEKKKRIRKYKKSLAFKKYISVVPNVPYRTIYSNAPQAEWESKSKSGEKMVRCFKLINPNVEFSDMVEKEGDSEEDEENSDFLPRGIYYKNMPIVFQAYHHIKNAGPRGLSHSELGQIMGLNICFVRGLIKRLCIEKLCKFYIETEGKRRSKRFMVGEHAQTKQAASEIAQILSETTIRSDNNVKNLQEDSTPLKADEPDKEEKITLPKLQDEKMSYRKLKRIGLIIKTIKAHRFRRFHQIKNYVHQEEKKEGLTITVDRFTIQKLLKKLENDGLIKKFVLAGKDNAEDSIKIYTDPAFDPDENLKESIFDAQSSLAYVPDHKENAPTTLEAEFFTALIENLGGMQRMLKGVTRVMEKPSARECELSYLFSPKFMRLNVLHDFMFYLVYDYNVLNGESQEELLEALCRTTAIEDDIRAEMPRLYSTDVSTYMFVPPLNNSGKAPGWLLISDLLTRMPLSVMVKVIKINDNCPKLWNYLNHPIRRHFLVKDLPLSIRQIFFCRRNQTQNFYIDMKRLCFMGLVQFGPKFEKKYYQTAMYLNRKASLQDTTCSPPAYLKVPAGMEFDVKSYEFQTKEDVRKYWLDLFDICMGTKLGEKELMPENEAFVEREICKDSLKKYLEPKTLEEALEQDKGEIPGDHLGAAGLDSCMFSFLRNNWTGPAAKNFPRKLHSEAFMKMPTSPSSRERKEEEESERGGKKCGSIKAVGDGTDKAEFTPKANSKRKVRERDKKRKRLRKPSYDEADLEALKQMNTLRVTWSSQEDNLLLLCRVAMTFLCPNSKAFGKIPRTEVRRALQQYLPESRNKTQSATARRILYMMRNPTTVRSVNLCLEKLKELPESKSFECAELVEKIKPSAPDLAECQQELYKKFHKLVAFLKDRFIDNPTSNPGKDNKDLIPNSLEEFQEKFQLEVPVREEMSVKSIRENVIRGTLMSSFCCRSDKTSPAVQLFDIYRQYNEDELQNAIKDLHQNKVITVAKKTGSSMLKSGNILPLTFSPFKLSFAFQHIFTQKYAHSIYPESFSQVTEFLHLNEHEEAQLDLDDCNVASFLLSSRDILSFRPVLPDQIIALEKGDLSDSTYTKMLAKYCKMLEYNHPESKVVCSFGKIITRPEDLDAKAVEEKKRGPSDSDELEGKKTKTGSEGKDRRTSTLGEPSRAAPNAPEEAQTPDQGSEKKTSSSRAILYMMREEANKEAKQELSGRLMQEFCVVNSSQVFVKCRKHELEEYVKKGSPKVTNVLVRNITSRSLYPISLVDEDPVIENFQDKDSIPAMKQTLGFICSKKELGATAHDLKSNCPHRMLTTFLRTLTDAKVILKTGIHETRYVSQKYGTPWLLSSFKIKRIDREKLKPNEAVAVALTNATPEDEPPKKKIKGVVQLNSEELSAQASVSNVTNKIKVIIRPWIRIDGSLNRKVLDRFLGTILGFVMAHPGCTLKVIMDKFVPFITPVWTKDLVEILHEIGCLVIKTFVVVEKASLFTKSCVELSDEYTGLERDDCVVVESTADAVNVLGLFIGKKTYSKDFLSDSS